MRGRGRGKKNPRIINGGYGAGRGKTGSTGIGREETGSIGVGRGETLVDKFLKTKLGKTIDNDQKNETVGQSSASHRGPFGGEGFLGQVEDPSDDEVQITAVIESPAKSSGNLGFSGHEKARRKLSQLGNVSVTRRQRSSSMQTEAGDIEVKKDAKGICPMCQKELWMDELGPHAADCQG